MKRKITVLIGATLLIVCALALFCACNRNPKNADGDNVSRQTLAYYAGESEQFAVSVEKGRRERTFIADGKATDVIDFAELIVQPLKLTECTEISYVINGDGKTLSGQLKVSDYGEFCEQITLDFVPTSINVTVGAISDDIQLSDILNGCLTSQEVIEIAKKEVADKLADSPSREIYLKLITGDRITYYYYVSFIGEGVDYWAMLVEPKSGTIITKK